MALSEFDRKLLDRCLSRESGAWEAFVDRFTGLFFHVVNHTAQARSVRLTPQDCDDLCAEIYLAIVKDDFALLRNFRGQSSLPTYLTVVARRIVVRQMMRQKSPTRLGEVANEHLADAAGQGEQRIADREQVERLIDRLDAKEAEVVRLYHLEGKSYQEISASVGMPENSIGPTLSRARQKMRGPDQTPAPNR